MAECDDMHKAFGPLAGGAIQVGELPDWTRIRGRVAWYVYRGPYRDLGETGWRVFWHKVTEAKLTMAGVPGDLYVCSPDAHAGDAQRDMLTLLWAPVR